MSNEIDREIRSKEVKSSSPGDGYKVTEQHTTRSRVENNNTLGVLIASMLILVVGVAAVAYYLTNRPTPTIVIPGATNTTKEKSTVIERNNATTKETTPAPNVEVNIPEQPAPNVEVNIPEQPTPNVEVNVPEQPTPNVEVNIPPTVVDENTKDVPTTSPSKSE